MRKHSTTEAAKRLGIARASLNRYIAAGKITAPPAGIIGDVRVRLWTDRDIERVRKQIGNLKPIDGRRKESKRKKAKKSMKRKKQ